MNKIFVHCSLPKKELEILKKNFLLKIHHSKNIVLNEDEFFIKAKGFNGIISQGNVINKNFIKANKNSLKAISNVGVGYDNIDIDAATKSGVAVFNTPNLMNGAVADLTLGLILSVVRKICLGNKFVKDRKWKGNSWDLFWGESLQSEKIGIIGLGNIGKEVALRARSFGLEVFYHNRNILNNSTEKKYKVKYLNFDDLISRCKFIVLLLPLTKESKHLFTKKEFKKMRKDSYIINMARGKIIKETDLVDALKKNQIAGAALDVFENEPKVEKKLLTLNNVVLMPHAGSATVIARTKMMQLACNNLKNFFLKGTLDNLVNKGFK
ncbi:MAG: Glyoxylate/hydroxypyruvate reductase B [Alphaproteobacteria bacterium MarineAlpha9_Bin4]|nr:MAG: Glyoxylate/hydroxypyruvate reductase B [Alphaproteobacteria bacterium MarineAlpha9_Bin4]